MLVDRLQDDRQLSPFPGVHNLCNPLPPSVWVGPVIASIRKEFSKREEIRFP